MIDDSSNGSFLVAGDSTFSLNDGDILLDNSTHDFQGVVKAETFGATDNDISLADANSIVLGDQAASGNLTVSAGGAISTDTVSSVNINVGKMVSLTADDGDALNANNNITFGGAGDSVLLGKLELNTADTATLSMSGNVELSGTSSAGDLFLDTTGELSGDLSSSLAVSGDLDLSANKIDLNDPANFTLTAGGLTFNSSGDVDLHIASAVTLKGNSGADNLVLVSTGAITNESGADLIVNNKASFSGSSIDLGDQTSDSLTFASLNFNSTGDVSIVADVAILLDGTMTADDLTLVATGNISNTAGIDLQVSGLTELQGSKISLGDTMTGENIQLTTLTVSGTDVSIEADSAVTLVGTNTANDLVLESSGAISNGANASLNVSGSAEFTGSSIHLGGQSGDSINVSKLTLNSAGAATYAADTDVHFVGSSHVKSLTLESTGTIDNATGASIEVDNALDITAQTSIDFGTAASDSLKVGTLTFSSPGDVAFGFESNVTLVNQSDANRLVLETTGSLDDVSNVMLLTVFGNASFEANSIDLGDATTDIQLGSLTFNSTGDVDFFLSDDTTLSGTSTADSLTIDSNRILNDVNADLTVTGLASFDASEIVLGDQSGDSIRFGSLSFDTLGIGNVDIFLDDSVILSSDLNAANLDLRSTATISSDSTIDFEVSGHTNLEGTQISLGDTMSGETVQLGTLTVNSTGDVSIDADVDISLVGTNTAADLILVSSGSITNQASASITVSGTADLHAFDTIELGRQSGDFVDFNQLTLNFTDGTNSSFINVDADVRFAGTSQIDSLQLESLGKIDNSAGATLDIDSEFNVTGTTIDLGTAGGDTLNLTLVTFNSTGDVTLDLDEDVTVRNSNTAANLTLNSTGTLTTSGPTSISVTSATALDANEIQLADTNVNFSTNTLTFTAVNDADILHSGNLVLTGASSADNADLEASSITNTASSSLNVTTQLRLDGNSITLGNQAGDSVNANQFEFNSTGAVVAEFDSAVSLAGTNTADTLSLKSTGAITDEIGTGLTATGLVTLEGSSITLGDDATDNYYMGGLNFTSSGSVQIECLSDIVIEGNNSANQLDLKSKGDVSNAANAVVNVVGSSTFTGDTITLGNQTGDLINFGSVSLDAVNNAVLYEDSATEITGTSLSNQLEIHSLGAITNSLTNLTVTTDLVLSGTSIDLSMSGGTMSAASVEFNSAGAVELEFTGDISIQGTNTADDLTLRTDGDLSNASGTQITVIDLALVDAMNISIGNLAGDDFRAAALQVVASGDAFVVDQTHTQLRGSSSATNLTVTSLGDISNDANATLSVTDRLSLSGTNIYLGSQSGDSIVAGQVQFSGGTVDLEFDAAVSLAGASNATLLNLGSTGAVTNQASATLAVTGDTTFSASSISLGSQFSDDLRFNAGLQISSSGAIDIQADSAIELYGTNSAGSLTLLADGDLTDRLGTSLNVTGQSFLRSDGGAGQIILGDDATDTVNFGSLGLHATDVTITESSATHLDGVFAQSLDLGSQALVTQSGIDTGAGSGEINVSGNVTIRLDNGSGSVYLAFASSAPPTTVNDGVAVVNTIDGFLTINGATQDVYIRNAATSATMPLGLVSTYDNLYLHIDNSDIVLTSLTINNDLTIITDGTIGDLAGTHINVANKASFTAGDDLHIADEATDQFTAGSVYIDASSLSLGTSSMGAGGTFDTASLQIFSAQDITIEHAGPSPLAFEGDSTIHGDLTLATTSSITNLANSSLKVLGHASLTTPDAITLGNATGDNIDINTLSFNSGLDTSLHLDADLELAGVSTADNLTVVTSYDFTADLGSFVTITNLADLTVGTATIGRYDVYAFDAGSYRISSTGYVDITQSATVYLVGASEVESMYLESYNGDIIGTSGASLRVDNGALFVAEIGDIDLGSTGFTTEFWHGAHDLTSGAGFIGYDVYVFVEGNINLDYCDVYGTLYIETISVPSRPPSPAADGDVFQTIGSTVYANTIGIDAEGSIQLSNLNAYSLAAEAQGQATLHGGMSLNAVTSSSILGDGFGVAIKNEGWLFTSIVFNPFNSDYVAGVTAHQGHAYVETLYGGGDLYVQYDIIVVDPTKTVTVIAGESLYFISGVLARGTEGFVTSASIPLELDTAIGGTQFVTVDVLTGMQEIAFNYGNSNDLLYSAQVEWADGTVDYFNSAQLTAINPSSSVIGAANPIGNDATIIVKSTPYSTQSLLTAAQLSSRLTVYNDFGIQVFAQGGSSNLNAVTYEFSALIGRDRLTIPLELEESGAGIIGDANHNTGNHVESSTSNVKVESYNSSGVYVTHHNSQVYTVRLIDGQEVDRVNWPGVTGEEDLKKLADSILADPKSVPGTYAIKRVTSEGITTNLQVFEKTIEFETTEDQSYVLNGEVYKRWYDSLAETRTPVPSESFAVQESGEDGVASSDSTDSRPQEDLRQTTRRYDSDPLPVAPYRDEHDAPLPYDDAPLPSDNGEAKEGTPFLPEPIAPDSSSLSDEFTPGLVSRQGLLLVPFALFSFHQGGRTQADRPTSEKGNGPSTRGDVYANLQNVSFCKRNRRRREAQKQDCSR